MITLRSAVRRTGKYAIPVARKVLPPDPQARKLNFGAGRWYKPRWETVDLYQHPRFVNYTFDLRNDQRLPLADGCVALIFSSHMIEHIDDTSCIALLKEANRLLRPNGVIRLATPDMDLAIAAYKAGDRDFFESGGGNFGSGSIESQLVTVFASYKRDGYSGGPILDDELVKKNVETLNKYEFARWCAEQIPEDAPYRAHINAYDFDKLSRLMTEAGFIDVQKSTYRGSRVAELRGSSFDNRPRITLFAEAKRP